MPFDIVEWYVDGIPRGGGVEVEGMTDWEDQVIQLSPGPHVITFSYKFNPVNLPPQNFPPGDAFPDRSYVSIDDVYFIPADGAGGPPPPSPPTPTGSDAPTPALGPMTISPTSIPDDADYFNGFERGDLISYPEVTTTGDGEWFVTREEAASGVYSVRSPNLDNDDATQGVANLTFTTNPTWPQGAFNFDILGGTAMPFDTVDWFVDGVPRGGGVPDEGMLDFDQRTINLSPGPHIITFSYRFNPVGLPPQNFPPASAFPDRIGYFLDNVYFVPVTGSLPTQPPDTGGSPPSNPDCVPLQNNPEDFSDGTFPSPPWSTGGAGVWTTDTEQFFSGDASIRSPNLEGTAGGMSNVTLDLCDDFTGGVMTLKAFASVLPPADIFIIYVDGESAAQLVAVQEWTDVELSLSPGPHRVDFTYQYNMFGVDPLPPSPPTRQGAVWIDDVEIQANPGVQAPPPVSKRKWGG